MDEFVSIIIPTKNEDYAPILVKELNTIIDVPHEIIVVDKSKCTPSIEGAQVYKQKSDGLGNAVLEGLAYSKGNLIAVMDGDGFCFLGTVAEDDQVEVDFTDTLDPVCEQCSFARRFGLSAGEAGIPIDGHTGAPGPEFG